MSDTLLRAGQTNFTSKSEDLLAQILAALNGLKTTSGTKTFTIKNAPALPTEKPTGNILTDPGFPADEAAFFDYFIIDNLPVQWKAAGIIYTPGTKSWNFAAYAPLAANQVITFTFNS